MIFVQFLNMNYFFLHYVATAIVGHFIPVMGGQTVIAVAQTFLLAMPPKIAQDWFGPEERVLATAVGALANQVRLIPSFWVI